MSAFLAGFGLSLSLILAIGAQNAFVLRQGLTGRHVGAVIAVCALSDAALIAAGVAGFGVLIERFPAVEQIARWGGAVFLAGYSALSLMRALRGSQSLEARKAAVETLGPTVATALALTWLNPHVYLDTVILLGAVASGFGLEKWVFGTGAMVASLVFFTTLGYGAALLRPLFARPLAWRILDAAIAFVMAVIAVSLVR